MVSTSDVYMSGTTALIQNDTIPLDFRMVIFSTIIVLRFVQDKALIFSYLSFFSCYRLVSDS
jgi:hypothetical protein